MRWRRRSRLLSQASRRRRLSRQARADVTESETGIKQLQRAIDDMLEDQEEALEETRARWADVALQVEESALRPKRSDIRLEVFGLAWVPHWILEYEDERGAVHQEHVQAYPLS